MRQHVPARSTARLLVFSLGGSANLPPAEVADGEVSSIEAAPPTFTAQQIARGKRVFADYCARCHGTEAINAGPLKDLRTVASLRDEKQWNLVVFAGLLGAQGMPGFMGELTPADAEAVRGYVADALLRPAALSPATASATASDPPPPP